MTTREQQGSNDRFSQSGLAFGTREGYCGRHIRPDPIEFESEDLNDFILYTHLSIVLSAGINETALVNWVGHMSQGTVPTMDQDARSRRFTSFEEFERYIQGIYNRLNSHKKSRIRQNSIRPRV